MNRFQRSLIAGAVTALALSVAAPLGGGPAAAQPGAPPTLDVWFEPTWEPPATGAVVALDFDEGTLVSFVLAKAGTTTCRQQVTVADSVATFDPWLDEGACNPAPDDLLTATGASGGAAFTATLVVAPSRTAGGAVGADVDVTADLVSGMVPPGTRVEIDLDEGSADQVATTGAYAIDLSGLTDVRPWTRLAIAAVDPEGDVVRFSWRVGAPRTEVSPTRDLVNGTQATVTGTGFTPGAATLAQGQGFIGGIDESTYTEVPVAADGTFVATITVRRHLHVPTGPEHDVYVDVDCAAVAATSACFVVAMSSDGPSSYVDTAFRAPYVTVSVAPLALVSRGTGLLTVAGRLGCDPLDVAVITGTVRQGTGRRVVEAAFTVTRACTGTTWSASVRAPGRVPFGAGLARVSATATVSPWSDAVSRTAARLVPVLPLL